MPPAEHGMQVDTEDAMGTEDVRQFFDTAFDDDDIEIDSEIVRAR